MRYAKAGCVEPRLRAQSVAIHRSNHGLLVGKHLPNAIRIYKFNVGQVAEYFQNAPLVRGRLVSQRFVRQSRHGGGDLFGTFFGGFEVLFQFAFVHSALT